MGNCQAAEAASVAVQHPSGRVERLYWATSAAEVMRANPGYYVAIVTLRVTEEKHPPPGDHQGEQQERRGGTVRVTRVKLLKPRDTLELGHAYRLVATAEVAKPGEARKEDKKRMALESKHAGGSAPSALESQDNDTNRSNSVLAHSRNRQWRPSLHSIAEIGDRCDHQ